MDNPISMINMTDFLGKDYDIWKESNIRHGSRQNRREKFLIAAWAKHLLETHRKFCESCGKVAISSNRTKRKISRKAQSEELQRETTSSDGEPVNATLIEGSESTKDCDRLSGNVTQIDKKQTLHKHDNGGRDSLKQVDPETKDVEHSASDIPNTGSTDTLETQIGLPIVTIVTSPFEDTALTNEVSTEAISSSEHEGSSHDHHVLGPSASDHSEGDEAATVKTEVLKDACSTKLENRFHADSNGKGTKRGPTPCPVCHKMIKGKEQLEWHIRRHTGERPYKCDECQATFISPYNLKAHKKLHNPERPHCCEECGKSFKSKYVYQEHLIIHSGTKPYTCTQCAKGFAARSSLGKHMASHNTGRRDHLCTHCGKAFRHQEHLRRHVLYAHREKPQRKKEHMCSICGKAFARPYLLKIHNRVHSGERPYKCATCGKDYKLSRQLKEHQGVHLGIKLYTCTLCERHFRHSSTLSKHRKTCGGRDGPQKPGVQVKETAFMVLQLETTETDTLQNKKEESLPNTKLEQEEQDLTQVQTAKKYSGYWCGECSELYMLEPAYAEHMKICHGIEGISLGQQVSLFVTAD